ncbi:MAG: DNA-processing protein DprA [Methanomicrobiales archaeon]|nr:DNA-processing protein DprA [Methanomicrobiales archaeon]
MDNSFIQETALLACLNDNKSLKKKSNVDYFRDPASVHNLFTNIFENSPNIPGAYLETIQPVIEKAKGIREGHLLDHYIDIIRRYHQKNIHIIRVAEEAYPPQLAKISDPPFVIYVKGRIESLSKPAVAVIGTREISPEGAMKVLDIVDLFVQLGYTIVSGLARGTDTRAHEAALNLGGETIAVLPGDIENIVPGTNRELAGRISRSGALISEITSLTTMHRGRYIERNRITSGLARAVIVIETASSGGSIRQAETAFRQGVPVYAVRPVDTDERAVAGFGKLISMGATPINTAGDLSTYFGKAPGPGATDSSTR